MKNLFKNKKVSIIVAIVLLAIMAGIVILLVNVYNKQPAKFVDEMFSNIKSGNTKTITSYIKTDKISVETETYDGEDSEGTEQEDTTSEETDDNAFAILLEQMEYEIETSTKRGNTGKVIVSVTNKNINTTLKNYFSTVFAEMLKNITSDEDSEDLDAKLDEYLKAEYLEVESVTTELEINLVKDENGWKVAEDENDEYANGNKILEAILPGYVEYIEGLNYGESEE